MGVEGITLQMERDGSEYLPNVTQMITEVLPVGCPDSLKGKGKKGGDFQSLDMSN